MAAPGQPDRSRRQAQRRIRHLARPVRPDRRDRRPGVRGNTGAAYAYTRSGTRWQRRAELSIPRRDDISGGFGGAVALTGTSPATVALISGLSVSGITKERHQCGSAFEFSRPGGRWHERARVTDPRCSSYDEFGFALATSGSTALIGAPGADNNTGAAYLLTLLPPQASAH